MLSRATAVFALVFGAQSVIVVIDQSSRMNPGWWVPVVSGMFGAMIAAVVASIVKRGVRIVNGVVVVVWLVAMSTWPLGLGPDGFGFDTRPWPWFVCTVATSAAALAWPLWAAGTTLAVAPLAYGIVRATPAGGSASLDLAAYDVLYAVLLGGAVLVIITMLRQAAAAVDSAQTMALERYAHAVQQHATEVERVQVDAIVHDSVLTTLFSAARARTPEAMALAATMAQNAMGFLREASVVSPDDDGLLMRVEELAARIRAATVSLPAHFECRSDHSGDAEVTAHAAEAIYSATVQAMVNSAQHAGEAQRWFEIVGVEPRRVVVTIGDTGVGFDINRVPPDRLGVRISILERVAKAGGQVHVASAPGSGTVVTIRWPAADVADVLELDAAGDAGRTL